MAAEGQEDDGSEDEQDDAEDEDETLAELARQRADDGVADAAVEAAGGEREADVEDGLLLGPAQKVHRHRRQQSARSSKSQKTIEFRPFPVRNQTPPGGCSSYYVPETRPKSQTQFITNHVSHI